MSLVLATQTLSPRRKMTPCRDSHPLLSLIKAPLQRFFFSPSEDRKKSCNFETFGTVCGAWSDSALTPTEAAFSRSERSSGRQNARPGEVPFIVNALLALSPAARVRQRLCAVLIFFWALFPPRDRDVFGSEAHRHPQFAPRRNLFFLVSCFFLRRIRRRFECLIEAPPRSVRTPKDCCGRF